MEYLLRSFSPWLASVLLDVAVGSDVVQDPAHVVFIKSKHPDSARPMVILMFSIAASFWLRPTVLFTTLLHKYSYFCPRTP